MPAPDDLRAFGHWNLEVEYEKIRGLFRGIQILVWLGGAGTLIGPAIGAGVFLLMKNVVSSYNEHWLAIIGITFICCVMFFRQGVYGTARAIYRRRQAQR